MSTIKELKEMGAFVPDEKVKADIRFKVDGQEYTAYVYVKRLSAGDYESLFTAQQQGRSQTAEIISKCIFFGEGGKESISFEDAYRLHPDPAGAMVNAFNEVNAVKKS